MDIRRGIIRAFDSGTYLADVQIVGSMATILTGVPVAKQIGADLLSSGTKCGVLFFDETNPSDGCVVFVYEGAPVAWVTSALIKDGEVVKADLASQDAQSLQYAQVVFRATEVAKVITNPGTSYVWIDWRLDQQVPFNFLRPKEVRLKVVFWIYEATTYGFQVWNATDSSQVCEVTGSAAAGGVRVEGAWTACNLSAAKDLRLRAKGGTATVDFELYTAIMEVR
jgi:hypothetical protein